MATLIDKANWPRAKHFAWFMQCDQPHFSVTVELDLTAFCTQLKSLPFKFTPAFIWHLTECCYQIPELMTRIRGDEVVVIDRVDPSCTVLDAQQLFGFCAMDFQADFAEFHQQACAAMAEAKLAAKLEPRPGDEQIFLTSLPWFNFTSFSHPVRLAKEDAVPRFAWGKIFERDERSMMSLSIQVHHGLVDGFHVAQFVQRLQKNLNQFPASGLIS